MHIIQINASYKPAYIYGGPTMSVAKLCEELVKAGQSVEVLTTLANGKQELNYSAGKVTLIDGVPVRFFKRLTKDHSHFSPALLSYLHAQLGKSTLLISLVHIHAWWNLVSMLSCYMAIRKNIPVILSPRGTLSHYSFNTSKVSLKKWIHQFLGEKLLNSCHFHVTTQKEKEDILKILQPKSITIIPNFVKLPELQPAGVRQKETALKLLFLSRIDAKKGLTILFEALAIGKIPFYLSIAGNGDPAYIKQLKKMAIHLRIAKQINWLDHQDEKAKFRLMQEHDLLVLPSYDENFANVVIESLAMGTAVLLSEGVGLAEYVQANKLGWVSPLNAEAFCGQLQSIFNQRATLQTIRQQAPEKIKTDFSDTKLLDAYLPFYQKVAHG
ncbi:MAG: XrtY-associated glycosyltransferase XYAG1 [Sphingobacteriaceae bacterium]